jgi:phage baseplate assembly protein V
VRLQDLERLLRPIRRRIAGLFTRGVWRLSYDDQGMQTGQVTLLAGETRDRVEHPQPYGFTSRPLAGAEAFVAGVGGSRDHLLVLLVDDRRYRVRALAEGEVAIYDDQGTQLVLRRGGSIEITAAAGVLLHGDLEVDGQIHASGNVSDGTGSVQAFREAYDQHRHQENGTGGGVTDPPVPQV